MSIKQSAKIGTSVLLLIFILSSALSTFFIYKMKNNFTQVEVLLTRYTDVLMARYQLAIMRSNVNFLIQDTAEKNAKDTEIIEKNKKIAVSAKHAMDIWVKEKKVTVEAQKSADEIAKLFYSLIDRLLIASNGSEAIHIKDTEFANDFDRLNNLFDNYVSVKAKNSVGLRNRQDTMVQLLINSIRYFILCYSLDKQNLYL